jgi:hypothetical protein
MHAYYQLKQLVANKADESSRQQRQQKTNKQLQGGDSKGESQYVVDDTTT